MKIKKVLAGMMMCLAMASCIQDEALNVEAAIDGCRGKDIQQCLIDPNEFPDFITFLKFSHEPAL